MTAELLVGPILVAALVSGIVALVVTRLNNAVQLKTHTEKLDADRQTSERKIEADVDMAIQKLKAERDRAMSDKAWLDYELRRDAYIALARQIDCIFAGGDASGKPELHKIARQIRLVGSDEVVTALNQLFAAIKEQRSEELDARYRDLFNSMRRDIRQLHTSPPRGTDLTVEAFPIES